MPHLTDPFDILYRTFEMFITRSCWFHKEVKTAVYLTATFPRLSTPPAVLHSASLTRFLHNPHSLNSAQDIKYV